MGRNMSIRVAKYNSDTNLYEKVSLFQFDKKTSTYKEVFIDVGRNYEMFDGILHGDDRDGYGSFPKTSVAFNSFEPELREEIIEEMENFGCYGCYETSLADIQFYLLQYPTVTDYEAMDKDSNKTPQKVNPISYIFDNIISYINFAEDFYLDFNLLSYVKIIFYFS